MTSATHISVRSWICEDGASEVDEEYQMGNVVVTGQHDEQANGLVALLVPLLLSDRATLVSQHRYDLQHTKYMLINREL